MSFRSTLKKEIIKLIPAVRRLSAGFQKKLSRSKKVEILVLQDINHFSDKTL